MMDADPPSAYGRMHSSGTTAEQNVYQIRVRTSVYVNYIHLLLCAL